MNVMQFIMYMICVSPGRKPQDRFSRVAANIELSIHTEIPKSPCIPNPCENQAKCKDVNDTTVCLCKDGFGDIYCQAGIVFILTHL